MRRFGPNASPDYTQIELTLYHMRPHTAAPTTVTNEQTLPDETDFFPAMYRPFSSSWGGHLALSCTSFCDVPVHIAGIPTRRRLGRCAISVRVAGGRLGMGRTA